MDMDKKKLRASSCALLSASALVGATVYASTRLLTKLALDREAPKVAPKISETVGQMIAGSLVDKEILTRQSEAAQRLQEKNLETVVTRAHVGSNL